MLGPSTGPSQPLIALYSDALLGAKRRSRGAGSCMGAERTLVLLALRSCSTTADT